MKLYIFRCRTRPRMYGATRFETASNLPTDRCPGGWEFHERVILGIRTTMPFDVDTNTLRREVQKYGWYVWDETPAAARREPPVESTPMTRERMLPAVEPKVTATEVQPVRITKTVPP